MCNKTRSLKSCCLPCVTQASSHSLWLCREQAPTNRPTSDAVLGRVLTLGDFQPMISHSCESQLPVKCMPKFSASSPLKPQCTRPGSLLQDGCWKERKGTAQKENCVLWEETGPCAIHCTTACHSLARGFYNSFSLACEAIQMSLAYLKDGAEEMALFMRACLISMGTWVCSPTTGVKKN